MERTFRELAEEWLAGPRPEVVERELEPVVEPGLAFAVVGPRRAGKTYYLFQLGLRRPSLYFNFEDVRLVGLRPTHFSAFLKVVAEMAGREAVLLLDEVQNVPGWGRWVRSLLDRGYRVAVAGSTSRLDQRAVSTELRGRYLSRLLLPFSFREFLRARGVRPAESVAPEARGRMLAALRSYLEHGGYPEAVLRPHLAGDLLRMYRETVVYRDVVERHRVRDPQGLEVFLAMVEASFARPFSLTSAHRAMRGAGLQKSKRTLAAYLRYLQEAYYVLAIPKHGPGRTPLLQPKKLYPVDPVYVKDIGKKMETAVAVELFRRGHTPRYYRGRREVDFVVGNLPIQVTYASAPDEVERRELEALREAAGLLDGRPLLITWDMEGQLGDVQAVPLWRWLLGG